MTAERSAAALALVLPRDGGQAAALEAARTVLSAAQQHRAGAPHQREDSLAIPGGDVDLVQHRTLAAPNVRDLVAIAWPGSLIARQRMLPRQVLPRQFYLITRRCSQRQFLLRPDAVTNNQQRVPVLSDPRRVTLRGQPLPCCD
jgi:hypothetical protein